MIDAFLWAFLNFYNGCKYKKSPCSKFKTRRRACNYYSPLFVVKIGIV